MTRTQIEKQVWVNDNNHPVIAVNKLLKETREYIEAQETIEIYNGVKALTAAQLNRLMTARTIVKFSR